MAVQTDSYNSISKESYICTLYACRYVCICAYIALSRVCMFIAEFVGGISKLNVTLVMIA